LGAKGQKNAVYSRESQEAGGSFGEGTLVVALGYVETKIELESSSSTNGVIDIRNRKRALDGSCIDSRVVTAFSHFVLLLYIDNWRGHSDRATRASENAL